MLIIKKDIILIKFRICVDNTNNSITFFGTNAEYKILFEGNWCNLISVVIYMFA